MSSQASLKFNKINTEIAKQLIDKKVFSLTLTPYKNVVNVPQAVEGLVYDGTTKTGVLPGDGYTLQSSEATEAGSYTASATLEEGMVWSDKTIEPKQINWFISKANIEVNILGGSKEVVYDKNTTYTFPDAGDVAYTSTSEAAFFDSNKVKITPDLEPVNGKNANTYYLGLNTEYTFSYSDSTNVNVTK